MDVRSKFAPSPVEGTAADVKKDQDVNGKHHPRTLRKKDPDGTKNNVQPTRYNIQKTKDFVKRQKFKGQYHGGAEENSKVVVRKLPERGSVLVQRSKKENGNHLLNFRYERDKVGDAGGLNRNTGRYGRKNNRSLPPVQQHKYNKEQFVQSSCQFVVSACGDYSLHLSDPDTLVDWKLIEQVKFYSSEELFCPICLHAPAAGRITRCGHIYCWPCILRYLYIYDDNDSCRCPICYEYVHKNDLKSVTVITRSTFALGDIISLRLMRREKDSLFAVPAELAIRPPTTFLSVSESADNKIYSKLLIASVKDIMDIIENERFQLEDELQKNPEMLDYIEQALGELSKRQDKLQECAESKNTLPVENVTGIVEETLQDNDKNVNGCLKNIDAKSLAKQSSTDSASSDSQLSSSPPKFSYFYQAEDGQHIYLHAVNVQMLKEEYEDLEKCPSIIRGKLLEKEASIYMEDVKRRFRYLKHLPLNSPFELAEIELKPPLVSAKVIRAFHEELNSRQKRREQKKREEKKLEDKITEEENRLIGIYPTPNIDIESYQEFPEWQPDQLSKDYISSPESASSSTVDSSPANSSISNFESISSNTPLSTLDEIALKRETDWSQEQGLTFAAILTGTRNKSFDPWPSVKSKKYSNTVSASSNKNEETSLATRRAYNKPATAWPSVKSDNSSGTPNTSSNEDEKETYVREQKSRFPDHDTEQSKLPEPEARDDGNTVGKKKKKKKGKGTVLFKTGITSGYSL
ncbi:hypothetical protein DMN91_005389 [Ooceraea biroi]|uniref:E3 ubiquitin-protein ligase RNF10 n=1 Tax=Ooceraea biroi TaxID=2015173 RepID=A0A026WBZ3_OOCBI|nr:RING finger protein 10 [Ooceraea biroi]EZA53151.1 RING finger protein [Ooceraea biroi]RLU23111.1 hypothetical protein DMN91_005389 [Ooceraea biroi]